MHDYKKCRRCGKDKPPPRDNMSSLCVECSAETTCKHYNHEGGLIEDDWKCAAGVCVMEITAPRQGCMTRLPCRFMENGSPVKCDKFEPSDIADELEFDRAIEESERRMMLVWPVVGKIKRAHEGHEWSGSVVCPVCNGVLHLSHAAYNGHVWGRCETEGCVAWME